MQFWDKKELPWEINLMVINFPGEQAYIFNLLK
jgi:hypothetical protein